MIPHPLIPSPVAVIGANGRSGFALCRALAAAGIPFRPVIRSLPAWQAKGLTQPTHAADGTEAMEADVTQPGRLRDALAGAGAVVAASHARHSGAVIAAAPVEARLILMGSTRKFSAFPDAHGEGVLEGERVFMASGRSGVMLHPSMIYGDPAEQTLRRLARLIRKTPVLPLPDSGRAMIQPIHQDDVTRCLLAALSHAWEGPNALVIAGPAPVSYADCARGIARAMGVRQPLILGLPAALMLAALALARHVPALARRPFIASLEGEILRLTENRAFDTGPMHRILGIQPMSLEKGLDRAFGRPLT